MSEHTKESIKKELAGKSVNDCLAWIRDPKSHGEAGVTLLEQDALYEYLETSGLLGGAERLGLLDAAAIYEKKLGGVDKGGEIFHQICDELLKQSGVLSPKWKNPKKAG
ncbi:MAG: hypothetical protein RBU45_16485 [Myxococcota bacterium]|jgi:hypothetical protein|nr:hypothetical protein [Myxococcota bacterium]